MVYVWVLVVALVGLLHLKAVQAGTRGCNITAADWTKIHTALRERYFTAKLIEGDPTFCSNVTLAPDGLQARYGGCTSQTLEQALVAQGIEQNCRSFLQGILYTGPGETNDPTTPNDDEPPVKRAVEICSKVNLALTIKDYLCNPLRTVGCPRQLDILDFALFEKCNTSPLNNLTSLEAKAKYFEDGLDVKCMRDVKACVSLKKWDSCPVLVQTVLDFIVDPGAGYTCNNTFTTVEERCQDTFAVNFERYCPKPTFFEANFYSIIIPVTVGPVVLLLFCFCARKMYRAQHISSEEVLKQAQVISVGGAPGGLKSFHPELAAIVASKYKGVSFNPSTGEWSVAGKAEKFQDEQAAARFAYLNLAGLGGAPDKSATSQSSYSSPRSAIVSNDFPVAAYQGDDTEYVVNAKPLSPEEIKERRLKQLISFYEYWEPSKADIAAHAENLLNRHDFEHVARAVKTKYGVLPPGWAEELEV